MQCHFQIQSKTSLFFRQSGELSSGKYVLYGNTIFETIERKLSYFIFIVSVNVSCLLLAMIQNFSSNPPNSE